MLHDADTLHLLVTVDARYHDVCAGCLMQVNLLPQTLRLALVECLALHRLEVAESVMSLHFDVCECHGAAEVFVFALELHRV